MLKVHFIIIISLPNWQYCLHGGISFTKECYSKANGYSKDFRFSQDYNLLIKLLKVSKKPYFINRLDFKPFEIERKSYKLSRNNKTMQKIFGLISIIGIFNEKNKNTKKTFSFFVVLLILSIPTKLIRSILLNKMKSINLNIQKY